MASEMGGGDKDGLPRILILIAVLLGLTTAGSFIGRAADSNEARDQAAAARASAASASGAPAANAGAAVLRDDGVLRPLKLFTRFVGPEPLFVADSSGESRFNATLTGIVNRTADQRSPLPSRDCTYDVSPLVDGGMPTLHERAAIRTVAAQLAQRASAPGNGDAGWDIDSEILIATLPDWVDSSLQWTFDSMLDAIQVSAAQLGFTLVSFDLPDTAGSTDGAISDSSRRRAHENVPGSLLFRHVDPPARAGDPLKIDLLLVLLVPETTTQGVHPQSFARALDLALEWNGTVKGSSVNGRTRRPDGVAILGPSYSGSAPSIHLGLRAAARRHGLCMSESQSWFQIVTPTATNGNNPAMLSIPGFSTFGAVTRSDDETLSALANYLGTVRRDWRCGDGVALLVESNTPWGQGFTEETEQAPTEAPSACSLCRSDSAYEGSPFPCATYVPFPLHISRLRTEDQQSGSKPDSGLTQNSKTKLKLDERTFSTDRIPPMTPALTGALAESMISGMFRSLDDPAITAVGVLATDKRDHVFLAQELARHKPSVLQFTVENSFVYLHADARSYVRGTVIASTYSLNPRTQFLTRRPVARQSSQQFESTAAHGAFNALASLLGKPEQMLDYDMPAGPGDQVPTNAKATPCSAVGIAKGMCSPPVWISVAAQGVMLPVTASNTSTCGDSKKSGYAECVPSSANPEHTEAAGEFLPTLPVTLLVGLLIFGALVADQLRRWAQMAREHDSTANPTVSELEHRASHAALRASTATIGLWVLKLLIIWVADRSSVSTEGFPQLVYVVIAIIVFAWVASDTIWRFWLARDPAPTRGRVARMAAWGCIAACAVWLLLETFWKVQLLWPTALMVAVAAFAIVSVGYDLTVQPWSELPSRVAQWRRIPVLMGVVAMMFLLAHLALDSWEPADAILYYDRSSQAGALVSPGVPIILSALALYWWASWNVRRVRLLRLPEIEIGIGEFLDTRARQAGLDPTRMLREPSLIMGKSILIPIGTLVFVACGLDTTASVEGERFAIFLFLASACIVSVMAHTVAHSLTLAEAVHKLLAALGRHPSIEAIKTLAKEPFDWRLTYREPRRPELEPLARRVERIRSLFASWTPVDQRRIADLPEHPSSGTPRVERLQQIVSRVATELAFDKEHCTERDSLSKQDWRNLDSLVSEFSETLRYTKWSAAFPLASLSDSARRTLDEMELVVFFHAAIVMRDLLTRLASGFTAALGGLFFLLAAHLLYTFQGRVFWLSLDSLAVAITAGAAIYVLQGLERNVVLSALWETTPGRISVFGKLTWRMVLYSAIFILTLVATFFPELGGAFVKWLEPTRKLLAL